MYFVPVKDIIRSLELCFCWERYRICMSMLSCFMGHLTLFFSVGIVNEEEKGSTYYIIVHVYVCYFINTRQF